MEIETEEDGFVFKIPRQILELRCPKLAQELLKAETEGDEGVTIDTDRAACSIVIKYIYTGSVHYVKETAQVVTAMKAYKVAWQLKMGDACQAILSRLKTFYQNNQLNESLVINIPKLSRKTALRALLCQIVGRDLYHFDGVRTRPLPVWMQWLRQSICKDNKPYDLDYFIKHTKNAYERKTAKILEPEQAEPSKEVAEVAEKEEKTAEENEKITRYTQSPIKQRPQPYQIPAATKNTFINIPDLPKKPNSINPEALRTVLEQFGKLRDFRMARSRVSSSSFLPAIASRITTTNQKPEIRHR